MSDPTVQREISWKSYALAACAVVVGGTILGGTWRFVNVELEPIFQGTPEHRIPGIIGGSVQFTMPVVVGFVAAYTISFSERTRIVSVVCAVLSSLLGIGILSVTL